nr:esterase [Propionibacterium sp.]
MRIALALGSGGGRGYAHIGVLEALAARGHEVIAVAGTSAGALVGGLYAAGRLKEFTAWATGLTQRDILLMLDPVLGGSGIIRAQRMLDRVSELLDGARIEELPLPFTAVATDLTSQREVWFQHGPVAAAIRASIAIPTVITPVMLRGHILADGGLMNPVPLDALVGAPADATVAVDLNARGPLSGGRQPVRESSDETTGPAWLELLRQTAAQLGRPRDNAAPEEPPAADDRSLQDPPRDLKATDVLTMSLNAGQALVTRFRTAANPPDVWVNVPVDSRGVLDFLRAGEQIALGRELADAALAAAGL